MRFLLFFAPLFCFASITWNSPVTVHSVEGEFPQNPKISINPLTGNGFAVWESVVGENFKVQTARFSNQSWTFLGDLGVSQEMLAYDLRTDQAEGAFAIWDQFDEEYSLYAARYFEGEWQAPVQLQVIGQSYQNCNPSLAVNALQDAAVCWRESINETKVKAFSADTGSWGDALAIPTSESFLVSGISFPLALSSSGNLYTLLASNGAFYLDKTLPFAATPSTELFQWAKVGASSLASPQLAYLSNEDTFSFIYLDYFLKYILSGVKNDKWTFSVVTRLPFADEVSDHATNLAIAVNPNNNKPASAWSLSSGKIQASFFNGVQWEEPLLLSSSGKSPAIAFNKTTNKAIALWVEILENSDEVVYFSELARGSFTTPAALSSTSSLVDSPKIGIDSHGNALAIWHRQVGSYTVIESATSQ